MSKENSLTSISFEASTNLSTKQYFFMKTSATGVALAGNGEKAVGILQNKPDLLGKEATVAIAGVTKMEAGGTIAIDGDVASDAAGKAVAAATGDQILGIALASAVDGDIFSLLIQSRGTA